jgi:hypothetical protein
MHDGFEGQPNRGQSNENRAVSDTQVLCAVVYFAGFGGPDRLGHDFDALPGHHAEVANTARVAHCPAEHSWHRGIPNRGRGPIEYGSVGVFVVGLGLGLVYLEKWGSMQPRTGEEDDQVTESLG